MYLINGPANSLQLLQTTEHLTTQHNAARTRLIMIHRLKVYRLMKMMARKDTWKTILILCPWFPLLSCAVCSLQEKINVIFKFCVCGKNLDIFVKGRPPNLGLFFNILFSKKGNYSVPNVLDNPDAFASFYDPFTFFGVFFSDRGAEIL